MNSSTPDDPGALSRLADRAAADPFFLGRALAAYQRRHGLDDAALAVLLGCAPAALASVRLCRRPGAAAERRADDDVADITRAFGIDPEALRRVLDEAPPAAPT
jgi:hypothetical protein